MQEMVKMNHTSPLNSSRYDMTELPSTAQRFHTTLIEQSIGISFTAILMILTLFINALVSSTLIKRKQTFNTSYIFILNLCCANCVVGIFSMPWWIMLELYPIEQLVAMLGHSMSFFIFIDIVGGVASILSLTMIGVVRWLTVTHPLNWMTVLTVRRCVLVVTSIWVYSFIVASLKFVKWPQKQSYSLLVFVVGFLVPFIVLGLAYGRMFLLARYLRSSSSTNSAAWKYKYVKRSDKVTIVRSLSWDARFQRNFIGSRTVTIVTGTFLSSWLPFFVISLCYSFNPTIDYKVALTAKWLGYSNALLSPFVYTILDKRLKRAVLKSLCCVRR